MTESDRKYYLAREQTERELGDRAADPVVARVHHKLAELYSERLSNVGESRPTLRIAV